MEITWHGYSCFSIKTKQGSVVIDPYSAETGLKLPNIKADAVILTDEKSAYNNVEAVRGDGGEPKIFSWAGEYEVAGIAITIQEVTAEEGKKDKNKKMVYTFDAENLKVGYITDPTTVLGDEFMENIGEIDILMVPVGKDGKNYDKIHESVEEIEPRIVIPFYYKTASLKLELEPADQFLKKAGAENAQAKDKFTAGGKNDLPQEKTEVVVLAPQTA